MPADAHLQSVAQAELDALRRRVAELEAALHEQTLNAERYRALHDGVRDAILVESLDGRILDVNAAACRMFGATREQLLALRVKDLVPPDRPIFFPTTPDDDDTFRHPIETVNVRFTGEHFPVELSGQLHQLGGQPVLVVAVREVTERVQAEAIVRENERNLRAFFNTIDQLLLVLDNQGRILLANSAAARWLGYHEDELHGQSVTRLHPPERLAEVEQTLQDMQAGRTQSCDVPLITVDGRLIPAETRVIKGQWSGHDVIFGVTKDLSALKASEEKFSKAFMASPVLMAITELDNGYYVDVNEAFLKTLGYTRSEVIGHTALELNLFADLQQRAAALELLRLHGNLRDFEVVVRTHAGELRRGLFYAEHIQLQDRRLLLTLMNDITERQRAEAALHTQLEFISTLLETIPNPVFYKDRAGLYTGCNQAFAEFLGRPREEILGKTVFDMGPRDIAERYYAMDEALFASGEKQTYEWQVVTRSGELRLVLFDKAPLKDSSGCVTGLVGIITDITERKRMEETLRRLNADLEQRVADRTLELTEANVRLTELDRLKDEFISRISHELRTPLTSIKAYAELLEYGRPEKLETYVHVLRTQTDKLHQLIEDLLAVSNLNAAEMQVRLTPVTLDAFVRAMAVARQPLAQSRGLTLHTEVSVNQPPFRTDPVLLRQVLLNLVTNALNYTPSGGVVTLRATRQLMPDGPWVTIAVSDTGPGISPQDLPYIFEPFYRGEASRDYKTPGTGVGLSIARHIAQALHGHITVDSVPGQGAVFTVWLPVS